MAPGAKFCRACGQARISQPPAAPSIPVAPPVVAPPVVPPPAPPTLAPLVTPPVIQDIRQAKLICILGALQGMTFRVGSESGLVLGRGPTCDIKVPDPEVSKSHAWVGISGQRLTVRDLKSTNGTFLNDRLNLPITECELKEGDILVLGRHNGAKFRVTFTA